MKTSEVINGEPVKIIDYAYMSRLRSMFSPLGISPRCRGYGFNGEYCEQEDRVFKIGDRVVSKIRSTPKSDPSYGRPHSPPIWHKACYAKLWL